jgi:hypothetical protein
VTDPNIMRVLELRRAGLGFAQIAERLHLPDASTARAFYDQAMTAEDLRFSADLEAARLDRLHTAIWPQAVQGDVNAVDRVVRISERRERLLGPPRENQHELRAAFDASMETSSQVTPVDEALVEAGRKIADRVDEAIAGCEGQELTRALYLMPHMVNILREALATPASRINAGLVKDNAPKGRLAELRAINGGTGKTG